MSPLAETRPDSPRARALARAAVIGRYTVLGLVGKGGMGEVYAAYDPELNRKIAIKLVRVRSSEADTSEGRGRLMREAQAIAKVSHPNVVTIYDVGTFEDQVFIAMQFVEGHTLGYWTHAEPRGWPDVLKIFSEAGRGLAAAHDKGLVHRDFKPENVMVSPDGHVRVMDFGLARVVMDRTRDPLLAAAGVSPRVTVATAAAAAAVATGRARAAAADFDLEATRQIGQVAGTLGGSVSVSDTSSAPSTLPTTQTGSIVGTPAYMSLEQLRAQETDARSDQFSFCVALYEALYDERPFEGSSLAELAANVGKGIVRAAPAASTVPLWLRRIVLRGLRVQPAERWPTMKALLTELEKNRVVARRRRFSAGASAKLAGIWAAPARGRAVETDARSEMRRAFLATGKLYAAAAFDEASRILDRYAQGWCEMYTEACVATHVRGEQSAEVLDLRMASLRECLESLRVLVEVFRHANAEVVENAVTAARALGGLERSADLDLLRAGVRPPDDDETRAAVDALRSRLAEVRVLGHVGRYKDGLKAMEPLEADVRRIGYRPLLAETLLELGKLHAERRDSKAAARALEEALWTAELSRHDEVVAETATYLVFVVGDTQQRFDAGEIWSRHAETVLERMGGHDQIWGWLFNNRGAMREKEGRLAEALQDGRRAVVAKEKAGGANSPDVALSLGNIALSLLHAGELQEAVFHSERALRILEAGLGAEHPRTAVILVNYSEILNGLGRFSEAREMATRALAIFERESEPDGFLLTFPLTALGQACLGLGLADEALPALERSAAIRDDKESDPACLGEVHFALARASWAAQQDLPRARVLAERAGAEYARAPNVQANERQSGAIAAWLAHHPAPRD